jgi:hypothetical protein
MGKAALDNQNFLTWTEQQADCLRQGRWAELDLANLVEEVESLGLSEQRELGPLLADADTACPYTMNQMLDPNCLMGSGI